LTGAILEPLMGARQRSLRKATIDQLDVIKSSLLAHVVATGVLPCPMPLLVGEGLGIVSSPDSDADSSRPCITVHGGIPAGVLGLAGPVDERGALLDSWNHAYRYTLSLNSHAQRGDLQLPDWTTPGEASRIGISNLDAELVLCNEGFRNRCPRRAVRANGVVFVVLSLGEDDSQEGLQYENQDGDIDFLLLAESVVPETRYDDFLVWSTSSDIVYWLLRAGWLP